MAASPPETDPDYRLWEMVPLAQYTVPRGPDQQLVRRKWAALRRLLRAADEETQAPVRAEAELRALPAVRLENLVPPIDWAPAAEALEHALAAGAPQGTSRPAVHFLIGQPHCGHAEILRHWAQAQGARILSPPRYEEILSGDHHWLADLGGTDGVWVLPALERCFLRHAAGLGLVRQILERAASGRLGTGLIGCDSWAWAYLQRLFPAPQLQALTLGAFDGHRLADLFLRLSRADGGRPLNVRNARTGASVLPEPEALAAGEVEIGKELKQLAAHCRGNPGIAWRYWRRRLRAEPERAEPSDGQRQSDAEGDEHVVWLTEAIDDPVLPAETSDDLVLILHVLLLHNGLPAWLLPELLPMPQGPIASLLWRLEALGMVALEADHWRVAALGYRTAREILRERTFLVDPF